MIVRRESIDSTQCERAAVDWFVDDESCEGLDEQDLARWNEFWAKPENRQEYSKLLQLRQQASMSHHPPRASDDDLLEDFRRMNASSAGLSSVGNINGGQRVPPSSVWRTDRLRIAALWIGLLALAVGLSFLLRSTFLRESRVGTDRIYATAPGEQRDFILEDGSSMTLGGDTAVTVRFKTARRLIVLGHGEGMFRVRHDTDRSFSVCAANGCTTAVGTVFDVRLYSNHVRVWVQTGAVDIAPARQTNDDNRVDPDPTHWTPVRVHHGQEVSYASDGAGSLMAADPRSAALWTRGSLIYHARPLAEVIEDVQRYFPRHIVVNPGVGALSYSGTVGQRFVDEWIRGLSQIFPLEIFDCQMLQESTSATAEGRSMCASNPDAILIRADRE